MAEGRDTQNKAQSSGAEPAAVEGVCRVGSTCMGMGWDWSRDCDWSWAAAASPPRVLGAE